VDVKGKGLMMGIYLNETIGDDNVMLRTLFQQDLAGYLAAAWLLNNHQVRIFPSLAAANCLRVEALLLYNSCTDQ
jgi:acetylornithine/succinyldiaminopimelate/putrescine aminotransferase